MFPCPRDARAINRLPRVYGTVAGGAENVHCDVRCPDETVIIMGSIA